MEPYKDRTLSSSSSHRTENYISAEEFHNLCKSKVRISKSNRFIYERYRYPISSSAIQEAKSSTRLITRTPGEEIKSKVSKSTNFSERSYENSPTSNYKGSIHKLDPSSCFYWFFLGPKYLRAIIPEVELSRCKTRFTTMLTRLPNCHEAHFGLGKIYSHEYKYEKALYHFKEALTYAPNDGTYKLWYGVLYLFTSTSTEGNAKTTKTILESKESLQHIARYKNSY
jgi:hypothetical protein